MGLMVSKEFNKRNIIIVSGIFLFVVLALILFISESRIPGRSRHKNEEYFADIDHVIGVAMITSEDLDSELRSYISDGICEYRTDRVNSVATLAQYLEEKDNVFAIIADGTPYNPNMYVLCNGWGQMEDPKGDFVSDEIVCTRIKNNDGTDKKIEISTDKHGYLWLIYTKKEGGGSYYLKDTGFFFDGAKEYELKETYPAKTTFQKTYSHHIEVRISGSPDKN